jgi:undecaprenyl-diphosphatase
MSLFESIILGLTQGLTEFLPVSSSGHLILVRKFFDFNLSNTLAFDAILQLATTFAVLIYFKNDIYKLFISFFNLILRKPVDENEKRMIFFIIIGSIPIVVLGLLLEEQMNSFFRNPKLVAIALIFGSIIMFLAEKVWQRKNEKEIAENNLNVKKSFLIGLFQSLALVPGISRSGSTISGGLFLGISREVAVRFSFILSVPILFATGIKKLFETGSMQNEMIFELLIASLVAFITGFLSIHFLLKFLKNHRLNIFIVYRLVLAILILFLV